MDTTGKHLLQTAIIYMIIVLTNGWMMKSWNNRQGTTTPPGCMYNGQRYAVGESFGEGYDASSNWCYGAYCADGGQVMHWDNWNCKTVPTTTSFSTTTPSSTTPITHPIGCQTNGQFYPPGTEISRGEDKSHNWCFGSYCDESGNIIAWDDFNCFPTTTSTTTPSSTPTTKPTVTPPSAKSKVRRTNQNGCHYYDGRFYSPGEEIRRGEDKERNYCYGSYCGENGEVMSWGKYNCHETTTTIKPTIRSAPRTPDKQSSDIRSRMLKQKLVQKLRSLSKSIQ